MMTSAAYSAIQPNVAGTNIGGGLGGGSDGSGGDGGGDGGKGAYTVKPGGSGGSVMIVFASRRRFRFSDSRLTGAYKDAGEPEAHHPHVTFDRAEFAGVVCVRGDGDACREHDGFDFDGYADGEPLLDGEGELDELTSADFGEDPYLHVDT